MVIEYLKKIENQFLNQLHACEELQTELDLQLKESRRFIALLEETDDPYREAFSPRQVNLYQKRKLRDLHEEQKEIIETIEQQKRVHEELTEKLSEVREVIREYKIEINK